MRRPSASALLGTFAFAICLLLASAVQAQDQLSRIEIGGQFDGIRFHNANGNDVFKPGFGARLDLNLTRRFAFESTVDFFPRNAPQGLGQGGRTLQFLAGVRGKLVSKQRYSIYGVLRPGLTYETNNQTGFLLIGFPFSSSVLVRSGPLTHFTMDLGGGIEIYPSRRWIFRAEIDVSPYFVGNLPVLSPNQLSPAGAPLQVATVPGTIFAPWKIGVGGSYRVGALRDFARDDDHSSQSESHSRFRRLTVGAQAASLSLQFVNGVDGATTEVGVGPFASYRIWRFIEADTAMFLFPREEQTSGPQDGGRILQGFYGVRAGIRTRHAGFFAKARPGFQSYSRTLTGFATGPGNVIIDTFTRNTDFALDLGGVAELYPSRHFVIRLDAGITSLFPGARNINFAGTVFSTPALARRDTMQFGAGFGWRF